MVLHSYALHLLHDPPDPGTHPRVPHCETISPLRGGARLARAADGGDQGQRATGTDCARAARALRDADGFAVLDLDAALRLRDGGLRRGAFFCWRDSSICPSCPVMAQHRLTAVMHCAEQLRMLEALPLTAPVDVFLKLNTGMNRLGFAAAELRPALARLQACRNVGEITLMTHFACADDARGIAWQLERFEAATAGLRFAGLAGQLRRAAALPGRRARLGARRHHAVRRVPVRRRERDISSGSSPR